MTANDNSIAQKPIIPWGWLRAALFFLGWGLVLEVVKLSRGTLISTNPYASNGSMIAYAFFKLVGVLLLIYFFRRWIERRDFIGIGFNFGTEYRRDFVSGILIASAMVTFIFTILWLLGNLDVQTIRFQTSSFFAWVTIFIIAAAREEIINRGGILINLLDSFNQYIALAISAGFFAVFHLGSDHATILSSLNIFLAGIWLGLYYVHKRNLWFPIGAHFAWNIALGPIFGNPVSSSTVPGIFTIELSGSSVLTGGNFGFEGSIFSTLVFLGAIYYIHRKYNQKVQETGNETVPRSPTSPG